MIFMIAEILFRVLNNTRLTKSPFLLGVFTYAYFIKHFLGGEPISMMMLLNRMMHLQGKIIEDDKTRQIELQYNKKDPSMMKKLQSVIQKINALEIKSVSNKIMRFSLSKT